MRLRNLGEGREMEREKREKEVTLLRPPSAKAPVRRGRAKGLMNCNSNRVAGLRDRQQN
jgi:hypothetical protein